MKFRIFVKHADGSSETWTEDYDYLWVETVENATAAGLGIVNFFNSTLRSGEKPREFVNAKIVGPSDSVNDEYVAEPSYPDDEDEFVLPEKFLSNAEVEDGEESDNEGGDA